MAAHENRVKGLMIIVSLIFMAGIFIIASMLGNNEKFDSVIYKLTSSRSQVSREMMDLYPIRLFGQRFDGRASWEILDNTYVYTLVQLGVIMFLLLIIAYFCCLLSAYRHRDTRRLFIITVFILYGFMEQSFINPFINFSWLFIADMVWGRKDNNETWNCQTV